MVIPASVEPILENCSPANVIFASIVTMLVSFQATLKKIPVNINFGSSF